MQLNLIKVKVTAKNKFELIQNGYDLNKFCPLLDKKIKFNYKKPVIAMVCYDTKNNHQNLLQALSLLKSKILIFILFWWEQV